MKQNASLDSSFWINCYRVSVSDELFNYFHLHACEAVRDEIISPLLKFGVLARDAVIFQQKLSQGEVVIRNPTHLPRALFHSAEDKAIALAEEMNLMLLIDNGAPFEYAMSHGVKVINTAAFIVFLCAEGRLTAQEARLKLTALRGLIQENIIAQNLKKVTALGGD